MSPGEKAAARFADMAGIVNADLALMRAGRFFSGTFVVGFDDLPAYVTVERGRIAEVAVGRRLLRASLFSVRADAEAWAEHWRPVPRPGFHDLFAMTKSGRATVEGALQPLMANLQYVKDVLAAPRRTMAGA